MILPYKARDYVAQRYPDREVFTAIEMQRAFNDGKKACSLNTTANWVSVYHYPRMMVNQYVFVLCYSPDDGIDIVKILTTEFPDFIETHSNALYWCYEYRIAPKKIRRQFQEIKDEEAVDCGRVTYDKKLVITKQSTI